ncbi:hypothetical protein E3U23_01625 [Erythrobacter litoralis]|uniref:hypothetical protein n=1 Tax=Erythrobacter litoralis TaxID=39960 RepID=UPI002434B514|nr:hypothetical protein [Erythrobacter litoralis]MDG6077898.1 hypothetical protein [Erythrobacter litoralis]
MAHPSIFGIVGACLALAACSQSAETPPDTPTPSPTMMPVEPDGGNGSGAPPLEAASQSTVKTMPSRLRGDWHKDDLGRAPGAEDCDPRLRGTIDWDRLITVDENGYSYFETGGRIMEVHNRTDTLIDATFDTTYADTPTQARLDFALQSNDTMAVNEDDGDGQMSTKQYIRCPKGTGS